MGGLPANRTVSNFSASLADPKVMFVVMRDGFFKSTDAGMSWKVVGNEIKNVAAVAFNPAKTAEIYLSTLDGTIYVSLDAGTKWKKQR